MIYGMDAKSGFLPILAAHPHSDQSGGRISEPCDPSHLTCGHAGNTTWARYHVRVVS